MLELIVLGHVPGTDMYITYPQVSGLALLLLITLLIRQEVMVGRELALKFMNTRQLRALIRKLPN